VNEAFVQITGYSREEALGQNPRILHSGKTPPQTYMQMWDTLTKGLPWKGELTNKRKNGSEYTEFAIITPLRQADGLVTHYVAVKDDITDRKAAESKIIHLAFYDPLTQLPNRRLLMDRLQQILATVTRTGRQGALLFIDLDNFKTLNDTLGHDIGDLLLKQVAHRLVNCIRKGNTVARLGGDEFVVILDDLSEDSEEAAAHAKMVSEKIIAALNCPYQLADFSHHSTPSIGIAMLGDHQESIDDLLKHADLAMYQAKAAGRNTQRFFDPGMQTAVTQRANLEADLREAIAKKQFLLFYQAQVIGEGRLTGAEVLLRWQHPQRGLVAPAQFISLAEETGLILPIGQWVLETACNQLAIWADKPEFDHLSVAVNVSARQFRQPTFVKDVMSALVLSRRMSS
jgi:diguanylate cyclase (GGDEF)-like protein/PAS domain S-box-containing protein